MIRPNQPAHPSIPQPMSWLQDTRCENLRNVNKRAPFVPMWPQAVIHAVCQHWILEAAVSSNLIYTHITPCFRRRASPEQRQPPTHNQVPYWVHLATQVDIASKLGGPSSQNIIHIQQLDITIYRHIQCTCTWGRSSGLWRYRVTVLSARSGREEMHCMSINSKIWALTLNTEHWG